MGTCQRERRRVAVACFVIFAAVALFAPRTMVRLLFGVGAEGFEPPTLSV